MSVDLDMYLDLEDEVETKQDDPIFSHIVDRGGDERPVQAIILEAMVNGTPLTAICGHVWVPSRDPQKWPVCPKCEELAPLMQSMYGI